LFRYAESTVDDQHLERELVRSLAEVFLCHARFGNLEPLETAPVTPAHSSVANVSLRPQPDQPTTSVVFHAQSDADTFLQESHMSEATSTSKGYTLEAPKADPESDQSWKLVPLSDETILLAVCLLFHNHGLSKRT
jgi:hypothetical protein